MEPHHEILDDSAIAIYLDVPGSKVVLLQAYFELYEGLGIVRTLSVKKSLVCIITTRSMLSSCTEALEAIRSQVPWRPAQRLTEEERERYLGYFRKGKHS